MYMREDRQKWCLLAVLVMVPLAGKDPPSPDALRSLASSPKAKFCYTWAAKATVFGSRGLLVAACRVGLQ